MPEKITKTTVELKENRYAKIVFGQLNTHY
jgi:hypothetical protein